MPLDPSRSAMASAAGTTPQPGWLKLSGWESSVSSAWAAIPPASAALTAVVTTSLPGTEASAVPPWART